MDAESMVAEAREEARAEAVAALREQVEAELRESLVSEIEPAGPSAASCVVLTRPTNAASMSDISVGAA